jgi:hypothetical protein
VKIQDLGQKESKTPIQAKGIKSIKGQNIGLPEERKKQTRTKTSYPPFPSNIMNQDRVHIRTISAMWTSKRSNF